MAKGIISIVVYSFFVGQLLAENNWQLVSDASNRFTVDFYKTLAKEDGNIASSPLSAHAVLSMAYQGARGETKTAFENTLHVVPDKIQVADSYSSLIKHLREASVVNVAVANKLFLQKNLTLKDEFSNTMTEKYDSGIESVDFQQHAEAARTINDFVSEKTDNKITNVFREEDFEVETALVLVNTLYFKGQWLIPFYEPITRPVPFYTNSDKTVDAQMMYIHNIFSVSQNVPQLNATVLEMPFTNRSFSMIAILPNHKDGITDVESKLTYEVLREAILGLGHGMVSIHFPKFKIEKTINLQSPLKELGLGVIFDKGNCDLGDMVEGVPLVISKAVQKVYINVDEKGCEAAAASALRGSPRSLGFTLRFDHPFIFAIIEKYEGGFNVLFTGRVTDPTV